MGHAGHRRLPRLRDTSDLPSRRTVHLFCHPSLCLHQSSHSWCVRGSWEFGHFALPLTMGTLLILCTLAIVLSRAMLVKYLGPCIVMLCSRCTRIVLGIDSLV